jgi:DNA-directed RNA polymerase specialized sigma24 family protein
MNHAPHTAPCPGAQALDAIERLRSAPRGEPEARQRLIEQLSPELIMALSPVIRSSVTREMRRRAGSRRGFEQEIDDMVQSVLLALFTGEGGALEAWDPERSRGLGLESFVSMVAARQVDAVLRSRRRNPWTEEAVLSEALDETPVSRAGPETVTGSRRMLFMVAARLRARVSPLGMKVFEMLFLQDRPPEDVGAALGLRTPAVHTWRSRLSRAAREIVSELEGVRVPPRPQARARRS